MTPSGKRSVFIYFAGGVALGLTISFLFVSYSQVSRDTIRMTSHAHNSVSNTIENGAGVALSHKELEKVESPKKVYKFEDEHAHHDNDDVAQELKKKVRVLCWVMTSPQNLQKKAQHVRATWGKRCNILLFMSSVEDKSFPTVGLNVSEGRDHLTAKTMRAFKYCYDHYFDQADWFVKADDDTYVVVENLRYLLSDKNSSDPIYFGHHFKVIVKQGYFSGGAGYALSKEALRRFAVKGYGHNEICRADGGAEDAEFGRCMERLGVRTGDSRDSLGRSRFHCFNPETHMFGGYPDWYLQYDKYGAKKGTGNISDYAVTFHYVPPQQMYAIEFYAYHLRPYGITSNFQELNKVDNHR